MKLSEAQDLWRCDVTGNQVGTDTIMIGAPPCGCQGCRASRLALELEEKQALILRLERRIHNQRANCRMNWEIIEQRAQYKKAWYPSPLLREMLKRSVLRKAEDDAGRSLLSQEINDLQAVCKMKGRGRHTLKKLFEREGGRCKYCNRQVRMRASDLDYRTTLDATADHVIPRSRGGGSGMDNLVLACADCNHQKGNLMPQAWATYLHFVARTRDLKKIRVMPVNRISPVPLEVSKRILTEGRSAKREYQQTVSASGEIGRE